MKLDFNPRSRKGSDRKARAQRTEITKFQSTLPQGERRKYAPGQAVPVIFQSTLPQGERHIRQLGTQLSQQFQSTLPQGERQERIFMSLLYRKISIHAPARGATGWTNSWVPQTQFQSTLPQGERRAIAAAIFLLRQFQSTLPQGERQSGPASDCGVTTYFNPRSRKGSDLIFRGHHMAHGTFQSTLPQGERLQDTGHGRPPASFQSTLPQGERQISRQGYPLPDMISIHAPARGATAIITNFHTQLLFKITIFSYIASPLSFPSSLFPDI